MEYKLKKITLRSVTHDDLDEVARMWNFEKGEISLEEAENAINWMSTNHKLNQVNKIVHACFAIFKNDSNRIIGWCGLDGRSEDSLTQIFYLIDNDFRRRGYGTECARNLLHYGFEIMKLDRIDGGCTKDNIGSQKILEKIGMRKKEENTENEESYHYFMTSKDYKDIYYG